MNNFHCALVINCVLLALVLLSSAPVARSYAAKKPHFCGAALSNVLDAVCVNGFNTKFVRSTAAYAHRRSERGRRRARMFQGIVHECCRNGCIYEDLIKYCRWVP